MIETSNYLVERTNRINSPSQDTNETNPSQFQKKVLISFTVWLQERNLSVSTIKSYTQTARQYFPQPVNTDNIRNFLQQCLKKYEPATTWLKLVALISYTKFQEQKVDWPKLTRIMPKIPKKFFPTINQEELKQLKQARFEESDWVYRRNNLIFDFLFYTGIRINELNNVQHDDYQNKSLRILGKGNKVRYVFVPPFLINKLNSFPHRGSYIFTTRTGKKLSKLLVSKVISKRAMEAGIEKNITPHTFRRSFATASHNKEVKLTTIQKLLGHSNIETTAQYIHNDYDYLHKDYSKLWKEDENKEK